MPGKSETLAPCARKAGLDRRTLIRGAAWSIPVVSAVVASPALAASAPPMTIEVSASAPADSVPERETGTFHPSAVPVTLPTELTIRNVPAGATSLTIGSLIVGPFTLSTNQGRLYGLSPYSIAGVLATDDSLQLIYPQFNPGDGTGNRPAGAPTSIASAVRVPTAVAGTWVFPIVLGLVGTHDPDTAPNADVVFRQVTFNARVTGSSDPLVSTLPFDLTVPMVANLL
jgi:hypothetical protein